jgi:RNA polymerase sigma-70 factor (ECF subfamily)
VGAPGEDADWRLLARVAAGEPAAFEPLVERHQDRLLAVCERLLGDREEARDAVQEVFVKLYRGAAGFEPRGALFTFLYRIAVNHCLNRMRRRRIARFLSLSAPGDPEEGPAFDPAGEEPSPERAAAARERWRRTRRAIERLPPGQRAVLVLAKFEGLSYREIAAALGVTEGAVESRLVRALRRLAAAQEPGPAGVPSAGRGEP